MHYYQFNIGSYRRDTTHLSLLEHAIYRSLIDTYYLEEKPLCADHAKLMRTHSIRTDDEQKAFKNVLNDFFKLTDDGYRHSGCDDVLQKIYDKSEKARQSAMKRWEKDAKAMRTHSEGIANGMLPITQLPSYPIPNNKDIGVKTPAKRTRFAPPSLADVQNYFYERSQDKQMSETEGIKFHSFYESKDWHVGKNKMKDWQAAVRGWMTRSDTKPTAKKEAVRSSLRDIHDTSW